MVDRVIIKNNVNIYKTLKMIDDYIRDEDKNGNGADGVCPTCLRVLDMIECAMFDLTVPVMEIEGKLCILNDDEDATGEDVDRLIVIDDEAGRRYCTLPEACNEDDAADD